MFTSKLTIPIGLFLVLLAISGMAQTEAPGILTETGDSLSVSSGAVIAFGELIEPPYFVTREDGKVLINGLVFHPREKDPNKKRPDVVVTASDIAKHKFIKVLEAKYVQDHQAFGIDRAEELLLQEYSSHSLLSSLRFHDGFLEVAFSDGDSENIELGSFVAAANRAPATREQLDKRVTEKVAEVNSFLRQGSVILFGYEYTVYVPKRDAQTVLTTMDKMKTGKLSAEDAIDEMKRVVRRQEFADDVYSRLKKSE